MVLIKINRNFVKQNTIKMKNLKITISGEINTGKSTLASILQKNLAEVGYNVILLPTDDKGPKMLDDYDFTNLTKNTNIVVEEVTICREPVQLTGNLIEFKNAFHVTKDNITEVKVFEIKEKTYNSVNRIVYYQKDDAWVKVNIYGETLSSYNEIAWSKEEAIALQKLKLTEHLTHLENQQKKINEETSELKNKLNNI